MPSPTAGIGTGGFGSFGTDAFAFTPLAELASVASNPSEESNSKTAEHSAAITQPEYHPVPEPQTWVIAFSGLTTLVVLQRLRRRPGLRRL
ncbi:MAG TPA: hypothetical protein VGM54_14475 [Chthoniobacter sp.]|jgi:hypothetical protein